MTFADYYKVDIKMLFYEIKIKLKTRVEVLIKKFYPVTSGFQTYATAHNTAYFLMGNAEFQKKNGKIFFIVKDIDRLNVTKK